MKTFKFTHARKLLPKRQKTSNKTHAGRSLIIAGSRKMFGAGVLAATAAARVGSGYTTLCVKDFKHFPIVKHPDFLLCKISDIPRQVATALAIGPGLGVDDKTATLLKQVKKRFPENVVADADALNVAALKKLYPFPPRWVVTPHEGELARLLGCGAEKIRANRVESIHEAQKRLGCVVLLKGHRTLVASAEEIFEIDAGNPSLAKAGTGDVLTGIIAGLLAQGLQPVEAACLGAFLHGWIADEWVKKRDVLSLMARDLVDALPEFLLRLRNS